MQKCREKMNNRYCPPYNEPGSINMEGDNSTSEGDYIAVIAVNSVYCQRITQQQKEQLLCYDKYIIIYNI